ncbi:MAG TPA: DUF4347 domain-containing protein, partial [Burkholderiales bacterium]|nr:DUF4347 domain-containing protein [Burkholderiales bacterium]
MNALLRRLVRGAASPRAAMPVRMMQLEEMEARVLHSADLAPGALGDAPTSQVELRRIDPAPASPAVAQAAEVTRHELVIVDTATPDYQRLLDDIAAQGELHRTLDVLLIDRDSNGVQQITEALAGLHDLDAIHIISHGADGAVRLGSQTLDTGSLAQYAAQISQWGDALTAQADVLIYGCDVAQTETGRALLRELSALSGADVAGSIDLTGNAAFGGDWDLEFAIGSIESRIAVSADAQASWQGTLANSAPVITGANNLTPVNEDATNGGTRVADLVAGGVVTDADVAALSGIAVTAVDNTNGAWQYSTNGGGAWSSFGAPGAGNARLLAADANTYVRFVPNANWNGTVTNGLTFRAWDQTTGSNGGVAWTLPNPVLRDDFGTAVYTNDDGTARWSAGWVDSDGSPGGGVIRLNAGELDIRSNNSGSIYREADLSGATSATLSFTYTNSFVAGDTALINLQVSNNGGASYTTLTTFSDVANVGVGTFSTDISAYISASTRIQFVIASTSSPTRTLAIDDVQIACIAVGNGSSSAFSAAMASSGISVNAVNDAPTGANNTVTAFEDTPFVFTRTQFGFTDAGDAPVNSLIGVYITTMPAAGSLTLDNMAVTAGQLVSAADIDAGKLVFTGAANANATNYASFTFQVQDDGGTALGGVDVDPVARTMTINVTAVNDAPVGTNTTVATNEDTPFVFSAASFGFTDPSDTPANSLAAVKIAALPVAGTLTLNGTAVSTGQLITAADIAAGKLIFTAAPSASGAAYASFTFQVQDDGGVANGGIDLDAVARTMTIDVTAVNDAPVGTSTTVTTNEDTPVVFTAASFGFTDPGDTPANTLAAVKITTLPVAGALALNGIAVTAGQLVTAADIILGALVFTPAANANGAGYASFTFQVQDNGGGTTNIDAVARTMTIDVTAVNDAPVNTMPAAQSTTSNSPVTFGTGSGN